MDNRKVGYLVLALMVVALIIVLWLPVTVPRRIESHGKVLPLKKWYVQRSADGTISTHISDYVAGISQRSQTFNAERGDQMQFQLAAKVAAGTSVATGDTIATVYSMRLVRELTELSGELAQARAALDVVVSGEKPALVAAANARLDYAQQAVIEQQKVLARLEPMLEKGMISQQEFDIEAGKANLLDIEVAIAQAQLETAQTGEKPTQRALLETQIRALQEQLRALQNEAGAMHINAPFSGELIKHLSSDTLLSVLDISGWVVIFPLKLEDMGDINSGDSVFVHAGHNGDIQKGVIINIQPEVHQLQGAQVQILTARLHATKGLAPGMVAKCRVASEPVPIGKATRRFLNNLFH